MGNKKTERKAVVMEEIRELARVADSSVPGSAVANYAFDVTPARLITGLVTERGVCAASREGLLSLYPERHNQPGA